MFSLLHAAQLLQERIERALEDVGLSSAKHGVLRILHEAGDPLPLGELAGRAHCVRSNMTQLIDRLETEGLVRRSSDSADRRVVRAELTDVGRERAQAGNRKIEALQSEYAAAVPEADRAAIERMLAFLR
jgi:DNA-binding MarR family transcriptional regulator